MNMNMNMNNIMNNIEAQFRKDIIYHPDEDWYKFIYADWLEDEGRFEEAEIIRDPIVYYHTLELRRREGNFQYIWSWRKHGFVFKIDVPLDSYLIKDFGKDLFSNHPITEIRLETETKYVIYPSQDKSYYYITYNKLNCMGKEVTNLLKKGIDDPIRKVRRYSSHDEAVQDLSNAWVKYGRILRDSY